jgi:glycerol kinase
MLASTPPYILAIDQGTSGTSACLYDLAGQLIAQCDAPLASISPHPGWVEQDPHAVLESVRASVRELVTRLELAPEQIAGIGLANQGESLLLWDTASGEPIYNLIGWQCTRSLDVCQRLQSEGLAADFTLRTGLQVHPEWPATKVPWVLENVPDARRLLEQGRLAFSMGDSWLLYQLSHGDIFISDHSTASRSGLYNLHSRGWDATLLRLFHGVGLRLPALVGSAGAHGTLDFGDGFRLPLRGLVLDQASALLGQGCVRPGELKITYGTCIGLWCNVGPKPRLGSQLDCSVAWQVGETPAYACVGEADCGSSVLTWLREKFHLPWRDSQLSGVAEAATGGEELVFVPALKGLDAPYNCPQARGVLCGLDTNTGLEHVLRAALQAVAFTAADLVESLAQEAALQASTPLRLDGGMAANEYLMQFQADILGRPVLVSGDLEATARGAAYLARLALGIPPGLEGLHDASPSGRVYTPRMAEDERQLRLDRWQRAVEEVIGYYHPR